MDKLDLIHDDILKLDRKVERVDEAIRGNGKEGLLSRVSKLEDRSKRQPTPKMLMFYSSIGGAVVVFGGLTMKWLYG